MAGDDRPSAREISNAVSSQSDATADSARDLSAFIYVWGQFLDHDIDLTTSNHENPELAMIEVPVGDLEFDPDGTGAQVIPFTRSTFDPTTGTDADNPREQLNQITAWIDGSMIYGSDQETADSLRTFEGGHLATSEGDLPPMEDGSFLAGDIRANENIELTSMHALFVREHNRIADELAQQHPDWTDEQLYQQARAIVGAEIQAITYNEFLPALMGAGALDAYTGYDQAIDPSIANEFSTAAYRLHTLINDDVEFFGNDGRAVGEEVTLAEAFFNPALLVESGIDSILKYAASSQAQEFDTQLVESLRNFLFGAPGDGGLDLAALNIQRGRDHGLADYNSVRVAYGLEAVDSFDDITSNAELAATLEELYGSVDNIDLWVGVLAEDRLPDSSLGELSQAIISDQFERLRDGDRFWYQNVFSGRELERIERTTLADVIERNTEVNNLQRDVFFMSATVSGTVLADQTRGTRRPAGIPGVTVELLDDEGEVIDTTTTDARGRYRFEEFAETGDYQVRIQRPTADGLMAEVRDVLISRGDLDLVVNFGGDRDSNRQRDDRRDDGRRDRRLLALDTVFESDLDTSLDETDTMFVRRRRR